METIKTVNKRDYYMNTFREIMAYITTFLVGSQFAGFIYNHGIARISTIYDIADKINGNWSAYVILTSVTMTVISMWIGFELLFKYVFNEQK